MLLPYNVDRVTRRVPWVTYGLIAANTIIFLLTVLAANLALPTDREEGQRDIAALIKADMASQATNQNQENGLAPSSGTIPDSNTVNNGVTSDFGWNAFRLGSPFSSPFLKSQTEQAGNPAGGAESEPVAPEGEETQEYQRRYQQAIAYDLAAQKLETTDDIERLYVIEHAYDGFVDEPHYSILTMFAYRPNDPSVPHKIFTIFTSMFLHGSLDHLLGNMLFLWIFGRAIEEFLGEKFYLSTYLISGVAAALMQHIVTQWFEPQAMGLPNLGASGAIAGVLGLFAVRFYRTKVRIFYLFGWGLAAFFILLGLTAGIMRAITGEPYVSGIIGLIVAGGALFVVGRGNSWGAFRVPSIWMISVWIVVMNILPALWEMSHVGGGGGVAYWAHVGGLLCGAAYALIIGGADEGKDEYALEDAHTALQTTGSEEAIQRAGALLQKDANNPAAHEVAARGYDRSRVLELAAHHYNLAIEGYWKRGEKDAATRIYDIALKTHPNLAVRAPLLLSLASHFAHNQMWDQSAGILTRLVEEYSATPEAEIALLRAAQLWMKQYHAPEESLRMMELFHSTYPQSQWRAQAQSVEKDARALLGK